MPSAQEDVCSWDWSAAPLEGNWESERLAGILALSTLTF